MFCCGLPTRSRHFSFKREIIKITREKVSGQECKYFIGRTIGIKQYFSYRSLFYTINNNCMTTRTVEQYYIHITRLYLILLVKWAYSWSVLVCCVFCSKTKLRLVIPQEIEVRNTIATLLHVKKKFSHLVCSYIRTGETKCLSSFDPDTRGREI